MNAAGTVIWKQAKRLSQSDILVLMQDDHAANPLIELQTVLKRLGLYKGRIDGIDGPLTQAALTAFNAISADVSAWQKQLEN